MFPTAWGRRSGKLASLEATVAGLPMARGMPSQVAQTIELNNGWAVV
jgi:hypothetical protein